MTTNVKVFCDTNVVIRLSIAEAPEHLKIRQAVQTLITAEHTLWISRQVLREFCMVLTRPQVFPVTLDRTQVVGRARALSGLFAIADESQQVTENLFQFIEAVPMGGKQIYDANIVATMQAYDIHSLFTLNPSDFERFVPTIRILHLNDLL